MMVDIYCACLAFTKVYGIRGKIYLQADHFSQGKTDPGISQADHLSQRKTDPGIGQFPC